jgi:hypothetical protein
MQKKNSFGIMHHIQNMKNLKKNNFLFIGILLFVLLIQHFSFANLKNTFEFINLNTGATSNNYFEKNSVDYPNNQIDLFVESEDEDETHNDYGYSRIFFSNNWNSKSHHYSVLINTLYLRLAYSNHSKIELPFFVLYHAWKSDLS